MVPWNTRWILSAVIDGRAAFSLAVNHALESIPRRGAIAMSDMFRKIALLLLFAGF